MKRGFKALAALAAIVLLHAVGYSAVHSTLASTVYIELQWQEGFTSGLTVIVPHRLEVCLDASGLRVLVTIIHPEGNRSGLLSSPGECLSSQFPSATPVVLVYRVVETSVPRLGEEPWLVVRVE